MLAQLPTELKINIIEHVDRKSLPAVLRTNSSFREITEPILYSVVRLSPFQGGFKSAMECFPYHSSEAVSLHSCADPTSLLER